MKRIIIIVLSLLITLSWSVAYSKGEKYELFDNVKMYTYTKYRSKNQPMFLEIKIVDKRSPEESAADTTVWARPVATMLNEIIEKELRLANIAKAPTIISSLNKYRIEVDLLAFSGMIEEKPQPGQKQTGKKIARWFVPKVAKGTAKLQVTIFKPDSTQVSITEYTGEASRELVRGMSPTFWSARIAASALESAIDQILLDLDGKLDRT